MSRASFVLACAFAVIPDVASPERIEGCPLDDWQCLDARHVASCSQRVASVETCLDWVGKLERPAHGGSAEAARRMALAYATLSDLSSEPREATAHRERAIRIYRELVERDNDPRAMISLATMTDDEDEGIELLKRGLALAPDEYWSTQLLSSKLSRRGRPGDVLEAARHMEGAYDQQPGPDRWSHMASLTYRYYEDAGATDQAARFREKVLLDLGVSELAAFPVNAAPGDVSRALMALCDSYLLPAIGTGKCLTSIDTVIRQLSSAEHKPQSQELADVAARAMVELVKGVPELWQELQARVDGMLARGFDSAAVRNAHEAIPNFEGVIIVQRPMLRSPRGVRL